MTDDLRRAAASSAAGSALGSFGTCAHAHTRKETQKRAGGKEGHI